MSLVKKETRLVSVVETKPLIVRVPSFKIPVHQLKIAGIFLLSIILFLTFSSSQPVTGNIVQACNLPESDTYFGVISVSKVEEVRDTKPPEKVIQITDIIKDTTILNFICHNKILERAFGVQKTTGLFTASIIVQKGLESRWGNSSLCAITKNLGNIKCFNKQCQKYNIKLSRKGQRGSVTSHCVQLWDDGPNDRYIRFNTYGEGWKKYCDLIEKRYKKAASKLSFEEQLKALQRAGYATDKQYANKMIKLAKQKGITQLQQYIDQGYTITTSGGKYVLLQQ